MHDSSAIGLSADASLASDPPRDPASWFQSARADYSIRWTETGLLCAPPPESAGDWPSDRWRQHLAGCGPVRRCRHTVPEPEWWVLMAGRGTPLHPDAGPARDAAHRLINGFRGHPALPPDLITFTQEAVRDGLCVAPQPVTKAWVRSTLSAISLLVRWVASAGGRVTREHVFSDRTVNRFLYVGLKGHDDATVRIYRSRIDLVRLALQGVTVREPGAKPSIPDSPPETPLSPHEEAGLYAWAAGLRPETRRKRTLPIVTLALGVGARSPEVPGVRSEDVTINERGVHVRLVNSQGVERVVTCRREWEARLVEQVNITPVGHMLISPWRTTPIHKTNYHEFMLEAQERFTPPVFFTTTRLRNTWLTRMLELGVPTLTLMEAADLASETALVRLLPYCRRQDPAAAAASLRGHGQ